MRKLACLNSTIAVLLILASMACQGIWVLDPIDPRLPKYTESGNNVAGAYINDQIWESNVTYSIPFTIDQPHLMSFLANDSLIMRFNGDVNGNNIAIEFHLNGLGIKEFEDLELLANKKISLDGENNFGVHIVESNAPYFSTSEEAGQVYFRNVGLDHVSGEAILSGTFGFTVKDTDGEIIEISFGRFDYKFSKDINFTTL